MTGNLWAWSAVLATTVALASGCTTAPGPVFPPRPVLIDASQVPPCEYLTDAQRADLRLGRSRSGDADLGGMRSPVCTWLSRGGVDYNAQFIPVDAAQALVEPGARIVLVNGFGAVQNVPDQTFGGTPFCQITIDAAAGQTIRVQANTAPSESSIGIDEQCRQGVEAASMMMTTVVASASR